MSKSLILAEKPSVAREIARVLNCRNQNKGYIEGNDFIITWALGHLVTLAEPEDYHKKYKNWNINDLPMLPDKMKLKIIRQTSKQYQNIRSLLTRKDVSELIIATDSGREGELVARWIMHKAGFSKRAKRLWISSQTDKAIKEGFKHLRPSREFDNLYSSAQSRAEADWIIGLNITRALTCKHNVSLSAGRVQTPTLAMIVEREEEIRQFVPKDYWVINGEFNGIKVSWQDGQKIWEKDKANEILEKIKGHKGEIVDIQNKAKTEIPPLAYDLTELQRDANQKFNYSAKQTSSIMQRLYETYKLVTYPRTDSRYITDDIVPTLEERLRNISYEPYKKDIINIMKRGLNISKRFVNNSKVTDHHAIIPTEERARISQLNTEELNIYKLIIKRFIAVLSPPFQYEETSIKIKSNNELFTARIRSTIDPGWKSIYDDTDLVPREKFDLKVGHTLDLRSMGIDNLKTKPPARYTEATLLSAMENPSKYIKNKELKKTIENSGGLGTPATRADIIEKLFNTFYLERKGKEIYPTSKGRQIIDLVPEDLRSPELTAVWEQKLQSISKGIVDPNNFINEMKSYAVKLVREIISSDISFKHDNITQEKCNCGENLLEVNTKNGKMRICSNRECGFRKTISQRSNARCPQCHKKMEIKIKEDNKLFSCNCGYRENLSSFKKRKGETLNKKEVSSFLRKQSKDKPTNTPFADALAKLKE